MNVTSVWNVRKFDRKFYDQVTGAVNKMKYEKADKLKTNEQAKER